MADLEAGQKAPDFELARDGGGTMSLSALRGRIVVLYFYPKADTKSCTVEAIDFSSLKTEFEAAGATIVGVSPDESRLHDKFKKKHELSIDLLSDPSQAMLQAYGVWKEKSMYGKKYMGVERTTFVIDRGGRIAKAWHNVRVPGHAQEVLEAVRTLEP